MTEKVICRAIRSDDPALIWRYVEMSRYSRIILIPKSIKNPEKIAKLHKADVLITDLGSKTLRVRTDKNNRPGIVLMTSGTTGEPKSVFWDFDTLIQKCLNTKETFKNRRWLMCYSPNSFAGLSVMVNNLTGVVFGRKETFEETAKFIVDQKIDVISATPTYWHMLMNSWPDDLVRPKLFRATLGGEIVDQNVLDRINFFFDPDKIVHIYASTESGMMLKSSDGLAGYPAVNHSIGLESGDNCEIRNGRIYIVGREDDMLNVGGQKYSRNQLEQMITKIPGVRMASVSAKKSPITGHVLSAIVDTHRNILDVFREAREFGLPVMQMKIGKIEISDNGKKI